MDVILATEDELSEAIAEKLLREASSQVNIIQNLRKDGFGYLYSKMNSWRQVSRQVPVFIFTDLDALECAPSLIEKWSGGRPLGDNLHIRVAVREVESWLLADSKAFRRLIGPRGSVPLSPDDLSDPKAELLALAKKAPREIRLDLVQERLGNLRQALGYNSRLISFIQNDWCPVRASENSPSLNRTRIRLKFLLSPS